jgi:hypothetical protein
VRPVARHGCVSWNSRLTEADDELRDHTCDEPNDDCPNDVHGKFPLRCSPADWVRMIFATAALTSPAWMTLSSRLAPSSRSHYARAMCGRVRLSSDVSEIKLVFSIPPDRPTPNIAASWNVAQTDPLPLAV